ncbi:MAG: RIP metalloprotease RseP [Candidatus Paceibacterota bacterium]|jgi:regulator of sigma E protease
MSIIIFLIILAVLIFVHELGHFLIAKKSGIRVDEFAIGFPPKIFAWQRGETKYTINLIPFGGFVKIFGENPDDESISGPDSARSFVNKNRGIQAGVLIAGILFNLLFAWILISGSLSLGLNTSVSGYEKYSPDAKVLVVSVLPNSPAFRAGLQAGDKIENLSIGANQLSKLTVADTQNFIFNSNGTPIKIAATRGMEKLDLTVLPEAGIVPDKMAIGVSLDLVGTLRLPIHRAIYEGAKITASLTKETAIGLAKFVYQIFAGSADFSQVAGPVGIVGLVGGAAKSGLSYLLTFTAFISINLAVINLVPFPALDGGRLLFVAIEAIRRKNINPKIANIVNGIGFAILILLMILVTYHDIAKLVS